MRKADEINRELGYHKTVAKNAINIANIQFRRGNSDEGEAILQRTYSFWYCRALSILPSLSIVDA